MKYGMKYRKKFFLGILMSFLLSIFNGMTLGALKPIFDVYGQGGTKPYQMSLSDKDWDLLVKGGKFADVKKLIDFGDYYNDKKDWLKNIPPESSHLNFSDKIQLITVSAKLKLNLITVKYDPYKLIVNIAMGILPIYLLKLACTIGTVYFLSSLGLTMVRDIRSDLYKKLIQLPLSHFVQEKGGVWMSRVINDVSVVSDAMANDIRQSINNFFIVSTHLVLLSIISAKLLVISMVGVPLLLWPVNYFARKIKFITRNEQSRLADLNGHLQEIISGIRVIRAFGMENYEAKRFNDINHMLSNEGFRFRMNNTIGPSLVEFTSSFIIAGLLVYGGSQIVGGHLTSGSFFTFLFTLMVIMGPIKQLATWYNLVNKMIVSGQRIFELVDKDVHITEPVNPVRIEKIKNEIKFENVCFQYPSSEKDVLHKINLNIKKGSTIALVGPSGAGKSTFVDLLPRFYEVTSGEILFDNINIRNISLKELRNKIGIVTQEIFLFNASIRDNIAYGHNDMPIEKIIKSAKMAYAHDFIMELPRQYETVIGERGFMLSGGQRQRISIARALLKNPEILIFDEATSALDTNSERLVQKAIKKLVKNRTTFVIAHRLSTIYEADMILVFKEGKIVETGTHQSLIKKGGEYKKLYDLQFQDA